MKFPKAQPKPLSPCDDCLVTIRGDKGPAVRFGDGPIMIFEELDPPFGTMMSTGSEPDQVPPKAKVIAAPQSRALTDLKGKRPKSQWGPKVKLRKINIQ